MTLREAAEAMLEALDEPQETGTSEDGEGFVSLSSLWAEAEALRTALAADPDTSAREAVTPADAAIAALSDLLEMTADCLPVEHAQRERAMRASRFKRTAEAADAYTARVRAEVIAEVRVALAGDLPSGVVLSPEVAVIREAVRVTMDLPTMSDGTRLNRATYEKLIAENIARVEAAMPQCPERDHTVAILQRSAEHEYRTHPETLAVEQAMAVAQQAWFEASGRRPLDDAELRAIVASVLDPIAVERARLREAVVEAAMAQDASGREALGRRDVDSILVATGRHLTACAVLRAHIAKHGDAP